MSVILSKLYSNLSMDACLNFKFNLYNLFILIIV